MAKARRSRPSPLTQTPTLRRFQPLDDLRWERFVQRHARSSVFHTVGWLEALRRTYGYELIAYTESQPGAELENAIVFCRVDSWLTGRRLVSLPFSDHCDLLTDAIDTAAYLSSLQNELSQQKLRYIEFRSSQPLETMTRDAHSICCYYSHQIDLTPDLNTLFQNFHKDSTQRKIRRAEREELTYKEGQSACLLDRFYQLMVLTRRRHLLPPQPKRWFQNLIDCLGDALKIRFASHGGRPVAAILTLRHRDTLVYKYGCSDARFHNLGGMQFLFWKSIQDAKQQGLRVFDLGRSDKQDAGLITFKDRWGAKRSQITYVRLLPAGDARGAFIPGRYGWTARTARTTLRYAPDWVLTALGDRLYRHVA